MGSHLFIVLISYLIFTLVQADRYGADVSTSVSASQWSCLKNSHGVSFAVVRGFRSIGSVDPLANATLHAAVSAGLETHAYFFPATHLSANVSVDTFHKQASTWPQLKYVWLDVETTPGDWFSSCTANVNYLSDLRRRLEHYGYRVGIYTSIYMWSSLACSASSSLSQLPLWYPHYETTPNPSFSDFRPFGGWTKPYAKQFRGGHNECGVNIDADWTPN